MTHDIAAKLCKQAYSLLYIVNHANLKSSKPLIILQIL